MKTLRSLGAGDLSSSDTIVAVMGPTGVGKSTFIDLATGQGGKTVGHTLESQTAEVRAVKVHHPETDQPIVFVDTPGFDDTNKSDTEVLRMIANWLEKTYKKQVRLTGIIYMHRISDNRMAGAPHKNLHVFTKLCGDDAIRNVILATTMWSRVKKEIGEKREAELQQEYWKKMLDKGSQTTRFEGTALSAWKIVNIIVAGQRPTSVLLQEEMVDLEKRLSETQAGITLYHELRGLLSLHTDAIRQLREQAVRQNNPTLVEELNKQQEEIEEKIRLTLDQIQEMRIPLSRRIRLIFSFKTLRKSMC
ncbi:P-loop containing nucleoside triphosphate hydrolase protein [Collybia nuda]|uniref:P-loop containing nucleoside triphosphate hydrolase protein n=1 Tax=Collybia nuda TaxID=64659 RepID=A0A9P5YIZ4_9AGAR|nr:P-loop containing nucleoside triphosphate hydrolase protein [Collybia nuda]